MPNIFQLSYMSTKIKHYEKKGCFTIILATQFLSCIEHLHLIATLSKQLIFNTIQLHYSYTHDVMLMWLIVVHPLKPNMWHYEDF